MLRKKAIEIVVANVKMGWPHGSWTYAVIGQSMQTLIFLHERDVWDDGEAPFRGENAEENMRLVLDHSPRGYDWFISRKWLEEKGYI
jgi:hypothetical protein